MKKILLYSFLSIVLLVILSALAGISYFKKQWYKEQVNYFYFDNPELIIPFEWSGEAYEDYWEPHDIMKVPVRIKGIPYPLYLQFDTGAPYSMLYSKTLKALEAYHSFSYLNSDEASYVKDVSFELGEESLYSKQIRSINYGKSQLPKDTSQTLGIGTLGADLLSDKLVVVNFKDQEIQFYKQRPKWMKGLSFQTYDFKGNRIMLPAKIQGKEMVLFYDSGCSAFGLLTSKNRFDKYTDDYSKEINYNANSFGKSIPVHHKTTAEEILFGSSGLDLKRVSYVEWHDKWQAFFASFTKIGGWLGNKPFTESILILDGRTEKLDAFENYLNELQTKNKKNE